VGRGRAGGLAVVAFPVHLEQAAGRVPVMMEIEAAGLWPCGGSRTGPPAPGSRWSKSPTP